MFGKVGSFEELRMKDTYIIILCCVGLWFCAGIVSAQTVSNVTAEQVGKTIHIHYDLDRAADISVYLSTNGGRSYRELHQVSGDVGLTVGPGHNTIVWDVMEEVEELIGDDIVFMVRVDGNEKEAARGVFERQVSLHLCYVEYCIQPFAAMVVWLQSGTSEDRGLVRQRNDELPFQGYVPSV